MTSRVHLHKHPARAPSTRHQHPAPGTSTHHPSPSTRHPRMSAYLDGVKLLARRELSEAQVRQRLARRGHEPGAIDEAVAKLREERALDDVRVAEAIAREQTS